MILNQVKEYTTYTQTINKSKFICELFPINNEQEAKDIINNIKQEHPKAVHHCYAYIIRQDFQNIENQSDDGEPSKTAGTPMLDILRYENLVNTLAVVTRYFGGILLGTGGLIKAYSSSVKKCVDLSDIKNLELLDGYKIIMSYSHKAITEHFLKVNEVMNYKIVYNENVELIVYCKINDFTDQIKNLLNGEVAIEKLPSIYQ